MYLCSQVSGRASESIGERQIIRMMMIIVMVIPSIIVVVVVVVVVEVAIILNSSNGTNNCSVDGSPPTHPTRTARSSTKALPARETTARSGGPPALSE